MGVVAQPGAGIGGVRGDLFGMEQRRGIGKTGAMRPITAIILAVLLVLILGASAVQLFLATR